MSGNQKTWQFDQTRHRRHGMGEQSMAIEIGIIQTVVGTGEGGYAGDGGPATAAGLERPHGCSIDSQGNLYIADGINHRVRVVGMG